MRRKATGRGPLKLLTKVGYIQQRTPFDSWTLSAEISKVLFFINKGPDYDFKLCDLKNNNKIHCLILRYKSSKLNFVLLLK